MPQRPSQVIRSSDLAARKGGLLRFKAKREELDFIQSGFKDAERVATQVRRQAQSLLNVSEDLEFLAAQVTAILALAASITDIEALVADVGPLGTVAAAGTDGDLLTTVSGEPAWSTVAAALAALLTTRGDMIRRGSSAVERMALGATGAPIGSDGTDLDYLTAAELRTYLNIATGTFTPTLTIVGNLDAVTALAGFYLRVHDRCLAWGYLNADPTTAASTFTQLRATLPIASNLAALGDLAGTLSSGLAAIVGGNVRADTTNDEAFFGFPAVTTANTTIYYHYGYRII